MAVSNATMTVIESTSVLHLTEWSNYDIFQNLSFWVSNLVTLTLLVYKVPWFLQCNFSVLNVYYQQYEKIFLVFSSNGEYFWTSFPDYGRWAKPLRLVFMVCACGKRGTLEAAERSGVSRGRIKSAWSVNLSSPSPRLGVFMGLQPTGGQEVRFKEWKEPVTAYLAESTGEEDIEVKQVCANLRNVALEQAKHCTTSETLFQHRGKFMTVINVLKTCMLSLSWCLKKERWLLNFCYVCGTIFREGHLQ